MLCSTGSYGHQWNAPPMPYVSGMARSYGVCADAQQSAPFTPVAEPATASIAYSLERPEGLSGFL